MKTVYITRRETFNAAHKLWREDWSEEKNVPFLKGMLASTENMVIQIWDIIKEPIAKAGGELVKIKLIETENNFVEYYGGDEPY